ncbi:NAD(P)-binding protein [Bimuria novae-zelandiae CBS 107.79]|uniref:NAD(P)-binding protein n=1 Tax=Bimuria novae-zelandiae CBS 107.79 TaxID=1447943 RepID=A0A6A5VKS3_9PLEO|nr:NAD(P)-binding protein [Bimuria novae-zelandiae CBS 107.79]
MLTLDVFSCNYWNDHLPGHCLEYRPIFTMGLTKDALPAHYGLNFTKTFHSKIPANIEPSSVTLPRPFVVFVTGVGKGLGYHISLAFACAGCSGIAISSRTESDLNALDSALKQAKVLKVVCGVQSSSSVSNLEYLVRSLWGRVDVVIANAGVVSAYIEPTTASPSNLPQGLRVMDINLNGVWRVSRAFIPLLSESRDGLQTLISSGSMVACSVSSQLTPVAYNVSKMAVMQLMECVAIDHGADGVQAFALYPGAVMTPQTRNHAANEWSEILDDDEGLAGAFCVWLSRKKRSWLSGRCVSCNWDVEELEMMKAKILEGDLLKYSSSSSSSSSSSID